ncbi:hypothetical protein AQUCO_01100230v1 [Aquilegia coerulea]|uniref:Uncharacterized protein n=1 Tax=Aquilegia coerulea TaxID=218851 RepID=A0A2G5E662_AQUCA|nr:hypothetical protein AQUCO_01100230v1 [Aquilegia coerulea]
MPIICLIKCFRDYLPHQYSLLINCLKQLLVRNITPLCSLLYKQMMGCLEIQPDDPTMNYLISCLALKVFNKFEVICLEIQPDDPTINFSYYELSISSKFSMT